MSSPRVMSNLEAMLLSVSPSCTVYSIELIGGALAEPEEGIMLQHLNNECMGRVGVS